MNCEIEPHSYQVFWSNSIEDVQNMDIALDGAFLGFSLETDEPIVLTGMLSAKQNPCAG